MYRGRTSLLALAPCCILAIGLLAAGAANAAYPGANGKIAYSHDAAGSTSGGSFDQDIATSDPDGANEVVLTSGPADDDEPSYSADGERIAFVRQPVGGGQEIWVMNHDGSGQTQLTPGAPGFDDYPSFSPDGEKIAFVRDVVGGEYQLWIMNADGSGQTQLTFDTPGGDAITYAAFSPDGQRLVVLRDDGPGPSGIALINADGSGVQTLTTTFEEYPDFSPDGQRIAFERDNDIWVMNADGSGQTRVTDAGTGVDWAPVFSPDGTRIALHREPSPSGDPGDIVLADPAGLELVTPLTANGPDEYDVDPTWQPLNPPSCELTGTPKQKSVKSVSVTVSCTSENATVVAEGTGSAKKVPKGAAASKKKNFTIPAVTAQVQPGTPTTVTLTIPKKGSKALKKAQRAGKKGKATITATLTDDLGQSSTETFEVTFKKKKKK